MIAALSQGRKLKPSSHHPGQEGFIVEGELTKFSADDVHILASWDNFYVHNPLDVKESDDHALDIAFKPVWPLWPW